MSALATPTATSRLRRRRGVVLAWLIAAGMSSWAHAEDVNKSPGVAQAPPATVATATEPPFWVAGVVIATERRSALLVLLDDKRREKGIVKLREGESIEGYRLASVEPEGVVLEQNGTVVRVPVGRPYTGPRGAGDAAPRAAPRVFFVPGPDKPKPDFEYTGPQVNRGPVTPSPSGGDDSNPQAVGNFLEKLFNNPLVQQKLEEKRSLMEKGLEPVRDDGQSPTPAKGGSQ